METSVYQSKASTHCRNAEVHVTCVKNKSILVYWITVYIGSYPMKTDMETQISGFGESKLSEIQLKQSFSLKRAEMFLWNTFKPNSVTLRLKTDSLHEVFGCVTCSKIKLQHRQPKLGARIMLRNSGHGENITVCMGIFTIGFRR